MGSKRLIKDPILPESASLPKIGHAKAPKKRKQNYVCSAYRIQMLYPNNKKYQELVQLDDEVGIHRFKTNALNRYRYIRNMIPPDERKKIPEVKDPNEINSNNVDKLLETCTLMMEQERLIEPAEPLVIIKEDYRRLRKLKAEKQQQQEGEGGKEKAKAKKPAKGKKGKTASSKSPETLTPEMEEELGRYSPPPEVQNKKGSSAAATAAAAAAAVATTKGILRNDEDTLAAVPPMMVESVMLGKDNVEGSGDEEELVAVEEEEELEMMSPKSNPTNEAKEDDQEEEEEELLSSKPTSPKEAKEEPEQEPEPEEFSPPGEEPRLNDELLRLVPAGIPKRDELLLLELMGKGSIKNWHLLSIVAMLLPSMVATDVAAFVNAKKAPLMVEPQAKSKKFFYVTYVPELGLVRMYPPKGKPSKSPSLSSLNAYALSKGYLDFDELFDNAIEGKT